MTEKKERSKKGKKLPHITVFNQHAIKLQALLVIKPEFVYQKLNEAIERGEPWATQLYIRELLPASMKEDSVSIPTPENGNIEDFIKTLAQSLMSFSHYTKDELVSIIRAFSSVRQNQIEEKKINVFDNLSDDYIASLVDIIKSNNITENESDEN